MALIAPSAQHVQQALRRLADPVRAQLSARFFKTGPGQYGEGDQFIGVTVPHQRQVARQFRQLSLEQVKLLLESKVHEDRLTALILLVYQYEHATPAVRRDIYEFYLHHTSLINNWDLVDSSAPYIVGGWLAGRDHRILEELVKSKSVWERRIAIISTLWFIKAGQYDVTVRLATQLLHDPHDLIHKAVGWALREVGKRDVATLRAFLAEHHRTMPRTMLRYAIERFDEVERQRYLKGEA